MKLKAIMEFHDIEADVLRKPGDIFETGSERGRMLIRKMLCVKAERQMKAEKEEKQPENGETEEDDK